MSTRAKATEGVAAHGIPGSEIEELKQQHERPGAISQEATPSRVPRRASNLRMSSTVEVT